LNRQDLLPRPANAPRMRILIIEDEPMLALDLQDFLEDAGFEVVGIASRLEKALSMIETTTIDAAIVDANLAEVSSSPAAVALAERNTPFILLSGYSMIQQAGVFPPAPFIQKPCRPEQLIAALNAIRLKQERATTE
jgi:DNA-binding response OmpR family regulator